MYRILFVCVLLTAASCNKRTSSSDPQPTSTSAPERSAANGTTSKKTTVDKAVLGIFAPLKGDMASKANPSTDAKVLLGRMLYFDKRLSKNHDISCNSCHQLDKYGVDGEPTSPGHKRQRGTRNSPTVYNAAGHIAQFWDGRAEDVEEQAKGPILNPVEMAMKSEADVVAVLKSIPGYVDAFKNAFPEEKKPLSYDNLAKAIGAFERKLVTPGRWDAYLGGDSDALSAAEKAGLNAFVQAGCIACHTGPYLGGHMYQKLGLVKAWPSQKDLGRFAETKKPADKMMFKVPSLRNITKTGPYFHDGSVADLKKAIAMMAEHQLGRTLTADQVDAIATFFGSLEGELPKALIVEPTLPKSGPNTPKADPS